jgi:hypothetical protein
VKTPATGTPLCPSLVESLATAPTFETLFGATGCLTDPAKAFIVILDARDVDGLRALGGAPNAAGQLYALCGFKDLHLGEEEAALRKELLVSSKRTAIEFGDPEPMTMTPVVDLIVAKDGRTRSQFDGVCDALISPRARPHRRTCSSRSAGLTCR